MIKLFMSPKLFVALILGASLFSCKTINDQEDKRQQENASILDYVKKNNITVQPDYSGIYYISEVEGTGDTPGDSDLVVISYKAWNIKNNYLVDCSDTAIYQQLTQLPFYQFGGPSVEFSMNYQMLPGWINALKKMKEGGKAIAIIPSILTFNDYIPRKYEFQLIKVVKDIASYERQKLNNYLASIGKSVADSTKDGIYFIEKKAGTGDTIQMNSTIYMQKQGRFLDGRVFLVDTTSYSSFVIGARQLVPGLEQVLVGKCEGTIATVILPYNKAYGKNAFPDPFLHKMVIIPWYSPIIYDIRIKQNLIE